MEGLLSGILRLGLYDWNIFSNLSISLGSLQANSLYGKQLYWTPSTAHNEGNLYFNERKNCISCERKSNIQFPDWERD